MIRYYFFWILLGIHYCPTKALAQCPEEKFLWNHIVYLRDSSNVPYNEQLIDLLSYKSKAEHCPYRNDSTYALLLARIGWLLSLQKDFVQAIQYTRQSIDIIHNNINKPDINRKHSIKYFNNLAILYDSLNNENLFRESLDSCISLAIEFKSGYNFAVHWIYENIEYFVSKGDYHQSINYANFGEKIARESGYQMSDIYYYLSWKINLFILLNKYDKAEELLISTIDECQKRNVNEYLGSLYGLLANVSEKKGDFEKTMLYVDKSLYYDRKIKNYNGCAGTLNNVGYYLYFIKLHQYDKSLQYYYKALPYADNIESLNILDNIANVYVEKNMYDSALYFYQCAFNKLKPGIRESDLIANTNSYFVSRNISKYIFDLVLDKAECYLKNYKKNNGIQNIAEAINIYMIADKLLNKIKNEQTETESKLFWRSNARRLYEHAVEACYLNKDVANDFYFFEKSRAVLLNDQLTELRWANNDNLLNLSETQKKILQMQRGVSDTSINQVTLQNKLFLAREELDRLQQSIKDRNPLYYQSFLDTNFVSLNDVRKKILTTHNAFVELFNGDSAVYSLIITAQKIYLNKIDKRDYDCTTKSYISFISNSDLLNRRFVEYNKTAHHLYQLIFQNSFLPGGRIIISPDGEYFPFESLVTNTDYASPDYFLNNHAVSYTYSARFLLNDFSSSNTSSKYNFLGIAPVNYASSLSLTSLNGSNKSLNEIENYFSGTNDLISETASKNNFANQFSKYKIIQLYTHASDTSFNNEPVIFFADSALYLSELIPENKPSTQLIVLSACETGNGQLYQGEGVFSFNRGFAMLGIPSSVSNLWSVDDKSTYKLTELFYKYLAKGMPLDIALQTAKKEFIQTGSKQNSLPYYWAAPILVGKTDAIQLNNNFSWRIFLLSAGACLVLFLTAKYFVKRIFFPNKKTFTPTPDTTETAA